MKISCSFSQGPHWQIKNKILLIQFCQIQQSLIQALKGVYSQDSSNTSKMESRQQLVVVCNFPHYSDSPKGVARLSGSHGGELKQWSTVIVLAWLTLATSTDPKSHIFKVLLKERQCNKNYVGEDKILHLFASEISIDGSNKTDNRKGKVILPKSIFCSSLGIKINLFFD